MFGTYVPYVNPNPYMWCFPCPYLWPWPMILDAFLLNCKGSSFHIWCICFFWHTLSFTTTNIHLLTLTFNTVTTDDLLHFWQVVLKSRPDMLGQFHPPGMCFVEYTGQQILLTGSIKREERLIPFQDILKHIQELKRGREIEDKFQDRWVNICWQWKRNHDNLANRFRLVVLQCTFKYLPQYLKSINNSYIICSHYLINYLPLILKQICIAEQSGF